MFSTIYSVAITCFFEVIYYSIFKYLFATSSKNKGFFYLVSTSFSIINNQEILYLYYLI